MYRTQAPAVIYGAVLLTLMFIWPFGGGTKERLTAAQIVPGTKAVAVVGHDQNNNTSVDLTVKFLPPPGTLTPARSVYVVWIEGNGRPAENKGQLVVDSNHQGQIKLRTPFPDFELFITAEASALVTQPSGERVLFGRITRP
ncbi:MAG: hypothetical protein ACRD2F_04140 [Terriglobales bacterium]